MAIVTERSEATTNMPTLFVFVVSTVPMVLNVHHIIEHSVFVIFRISW